LLGAAAMARRRWAVARKLALFMHAMWTNGTCYVGGAAANASDRAVRAAVKDSKLLGAQA
jgi:transposase